MGFVYCLQNTINGKCYVGKTIASVRQRWKRHVSNAKANKTRHSNTYLCKAIRKYSDAAFRCSVLAQLPEPLLSVAEQLFIEELNTRAPNGYNLTAGGDGLQGYIPSAETRERLRWAGLGQKRGPMRLEQRQQLSRAKLGKKMSPEFCMKRSEYMKIHNPMLGRTHSPEARAKIAAARRRRNANAL